LLERVHAFSMFILSTSTPLPPTPAFSSR
jgi:hypothetical protein